MLEARLEYLRYSDRHKAVTARNYLDMVRAEHTLHAVQGTMQPVVGVAEEDTSACALCGLRTLCVYEFMDCRAKQHEYSNTASSEGFRGGLQ